MKNKALYGAILSFLSFSILSMAMQEFGSFSPLDKGFYKCIASGAVFAIIMYFVFRNDNSKKV